jgi:hypothetical protein
LYGVFVDEVLGPSANTFVTTSSLCHSYWDTSPLDEASAAMFLRSLSADDVAILIQSKSGTPLEIRRSAFARFMASGPEWQNGYDFGDHGNERPHASSAYPLPW